MARNVQRLSQLITTFGPGAMVDLPTRSILVGGLERWEMRENTFKTINEQRLSTMLEKRLLKTGRLAEGRTLSLRTPPLIEDIQPGKTPPGVHVTVFPTWFICDAEKKKDESGSKEVRRRQLVRWQDLDPSGGKRRFIGDDGKKLDVSPIRFVGACEKGHLQDIDWRWVVHGGEKCRESMWLEDRGTSADPRETKVVCGCGSEISLEQLFTKHRLGKCKGERPWLGDQDPAGCANSLRLLTRTATNTYFPQVATVISLPAAEDELSRLVSEHIGTLKKCSTADDIAAARRFNEPLSAALEGYSDEEVFQRIILIGDRTEQDASLPAKLAEFDVFASGNPVIGENRPDALLFAETLPRDVWDPENDPACNGIRNLIAVHRLREVSCLYGFTRFEAAPTAADDEVEDVQLAVDGAPLGVDTEWLPAVEQFGEGLFFHFDQTTIDSWRGSETVIKRSGDLHSGFDRWAEIRGEGSGKEQDAIYVMLHSLSHALLAEIALVCGYPASALKERIYALEHPLRPGAINRCGILIYTATSGNQGTLGGLVATSKGFSSVLKSALARLEICSNDPICADHEPTSSNDDRALHGAACHGCLLVAETSCESRNQYLDRALLVDTMGQNESAFFSD
ncbi:MAG: DUF1998 domain-containing protein [Alphaproteobacteria bacterium]|nr:DUF1998 domain-containing protein [Alphaproteobacteria bacterium]